MFQPKLSSSTGTVNRTKSAQKVQAKKAKSKLNNGRVFLTQNASIEYETDSSDSKEDHENNQEAFNDSKEIFQKNKKIEKNDSLPFMDDDEEDYQDLYKHLTYETKASLTSIRTFTSVSGENDGPDTDPNPDPTLLTPSTSGLYTNRSTKTKASLTSIKVSSVDGPDPDPNPDPTTLVSPSTTSGLYRNRSLSFDLNLPTPPTSFSYPGPFLKASTTLAESTLQTSNQNKRIMNLKTLEESSATCSPICIGSNPLTYPSKTLKSNQDIVSPNILSPTSAQRFQRSEIRRK